MLFVCWLEFRLLAVTAYVAIDVATAIATIRMTIIARERAFLQFFSFFAFSK